MALFNWSKLEKGPAAHPYYGAWVKVTDDGFQCNNDHDEKWEISFAGVGKISVVSYMDENPQDDYWLYFWLAGDGGSLSVPSKAGGFSHLLAALKNIPGFEPGKLDAALQQLSKKHSLIFENKNLRVNATLRPAGTTTAFEKIEAGLWLDDRQELIPWGSFGELDALKYLKKEKRNPPNPQYHYYEYTLPRTTICSGIQVSDLKAMTPAVRNRRKINPHWPVTRFATSIILGNSGPETLATLRRHITDCWKNPDRQEEASAEWRQGRVTIRLHLDRQAPFDTYNAGCMLLIDYEPDLTPFYTSSYQKHLTLDGVAGFKTLPVSFKILEDYTRVPNVFYTPDCFAPAFDDHHHSLIWVDEREQKTGFANRRFCLIFDHAQCKELLLETCYWRDELSGYALYCRASKRENWHRIASFSFAAGFSADVFLNQLKTLTGATCSTTEDRQYY